MYAKLKHTAYSVQDMREDLRVLATEVKAIQTELLAADF